MLKKENEDRVIKLCQNLVQSQSYSGEEEVVAKVLKDFFIEQCFDEITTDTCGNVIGIINGNQEGPTLVFDGHIDTVPVPEPKEWSEKPFGGEIKNNKIYGRGTSDMKGGLAAMAMAASVFAKSTNHNFPGKIIVAGIVFEELFEGVASKFVCDAYNPDYVVIGEATDLNLKIGQKGRAEIVIETFGTPAHSAHPEKGVNAAYSMCDVVASVKEIPLINHPVLKKGLLVLTDIKSSPYPGSSVVPDYCKATYDRRLVVGETKESVLKPIEDCIKKLEEKDPLIKAKVSYATSCNKCYTGYDISAEKFFPAWLYNEKDEFVQDCLNELNKDGFNPEISVYDFCTNGSYYAGVKNIKTIGLGPSKENLAHTIDEYIEISQLTGAVNSYLSVLKALMK
jgi:putative selenium metabolism hydrolase